MKKILVISHDFVKVNVKVYEKLGLDKNISLMCLRPKKLKINGKILSKDFETNDKVNAEKRVKFNFKVFIL